jgi:hypothetical protein
MIQIPVSNDPNQSFQITIPLENRNITLDFYVYWNEMAGYWQANLFDALNNVELIQGLPLLCTVDPGQNLLEQWEYLDIGKAFVVPITDSAKESPGLGDWDSNFVLLWGP